MRELSLFTGAGGGVLGTKLLGWKTIGYVEIDDYCQRIIRQRIEDGIFDRAPIFGDIRAFIREGYAAAYSGVVDVVTAGFPCQPFSLAGNQQGADDERNMWPETIECIRLVRPKFAFLENVPGLLAHEYIRQIFSDLAESGFDGRWCVLSAKQFGGPIERKRIFIACANSVYGAPRVGIWTETKIFSEFAKKCPDFWLQAPPVNFGVEHGVDSYLDQTQAIGNGQVPIVAATAWQLLSNAAI